MTTIQCDHDYCFSIDVVVVVVVVFIGGSLYGIYSEDQYICRGDQLYGECTH